MAVDHALLEQAQRDKSAVLRLYTWQPACLSFGRNQPARNNYDPAVAAKLGIDVVRRPTGGMAVLHRRELTYCVTAPLDLFGGARATYQAVNGALVAGLRSLGIDARLAGRGKRGAFGSVHPCFAEPAEGEVVAAGRKLVGSAQRCERRTLLQHGSILIEDDQAVVAQIAAVPYDLAGCATSVRSLIGDAVDVVEVASEIARSFERAYGICLAPTTLSPDWSDRASELELFYGSAEWTWRL